MRASLDSLSDEFLELIVEGLPHPVTDRRHAAQAQRKTLIACFLVSRRVRRIAQPVLWRCISTSRQLALGAGVDWIGTHLGELTVHDSLVPNEITPSGGTCVCRSGASVSLDSLNLLGSTSRLHHGKDVPMRVLAQLPNLSTLHLSKVTVNSEGFDSMPQLRDLGLSFVLFLESLQIQREGALTAAELKKLMPPPVALVVKAPANDMPYHRVDTPIAYPELYDVPATSSRSPGAKRWILQALQRFVFDALPSPTPLRSLTLPHTLLVPAPADADALEQRYREHGVALRGSESGYLRWELPRVTGEFARWWAGGLADREEER
ncbi:hypothetical protein JCM10449v2_003352 [Rhodotorula kratochvilovae]